MIKKESMFFRFDLCMRNSVWKTNKQPTKKESFVCTKKDGNGGIWMFHSHCFSFFAFFSLIVSFRFSLHQISSPAFHECLLILLNVVTNASRHSGERQEKSYGGKAQTRGESDPSRLREYRGSSRCESRKSGV
jgi:hypothetical protein